MTDGVPASQVRLSSEREIEPGLEYLPLAEAAEQCSYWRRVSREWGDNPAGQQPHPWWADSWFPITDAGQAGIIACDCDVRDGEPTPDPTREASRAWRRDRRTRVRLLGEASSTVGSRALTPVPGDTRNKWRIADE